MVLTSLVIWVNSPITEDIIVGCWGCDWEWEYLGGFETKNTN